MGCVLCVFLGSRRFEPLLAEVHLVYRTQEWVLTYGMGIRTKNGTGVRFESLLAELHLALSRLHLAGGETDYSCSAPMSSSDRSVSLTGGRTQNSTCPTTCSPEPETTVPSVSCTLPSGDAVR